MTCKNCTTKTPERQFLLIQKTQFSKFSPRCQQWWHFREMINQNKQIASQKILDTTLAADKISLSVTETSHLQIAK